jgi:hypothetical protein
MKNSFLQEGYNEAEYESAILAYLKSQKQGVTLSDVVVNTALKTEWTEYTLRQMLGKFPAHLEINDKQELLYLFDLTPKPLSIGKYLWQGISWFFYAIWWVFTIAFKVWMVGMLVTYGLAYALLIVIVLEAITRSGEILGEVLKGIWYGAGELWNMLTGKSKVNEADKHILSDIFSYVFGAIYPKQDKLATEKMILQQIRAQEGKLIPADIVRLTGWNLVEAQTQAAYLLANYQGEVNVTPDGKIEYFFPNLVKENGENDLPAPVWKQDLFVPLMNNLDWESHNVITGINIFNIVMSIVSPFIIMYMLELKDLPDAVLLWLTVVPFLFSAIFFLVPLCRYPFVMAYRTKVMKANNRLYVLGQIFERLPTPIAIQKDAPAIATSLGLTTEQATQFIERLQAEMRAEITATAEGTVFEFKELQA